MTGELLHSSYTPLSFSAGSGGEINADDTLEEAFLRNGGCKLAFPSVVTSKCDIRIGKGILFDRINIMVIALPMNVNSRIFRRRES